MSFTKEEIENSFSQQQTIQWYLDWNCDFMAEEANRYRKECLANTEFYNNKNNRKSCRKVHEEGVLLSEWFVRRRLVAMGHPSRLINKDLINVYKKFFQLKRVFKDESQKSTQ